MHHWFCHNSLNLLISLNVPLHFAKTPMYSWSHLQRFRANYFFMSYFRETKFNSKLFEFFPKWFLLNSLNSNESRQSTKLVWWYQMSRGGHIWKQLCGLRSSRAAFHFTTMSGYAFLFTKVSGSVRYLNIDVSKENVLSTTITENVTLSR